MLAWRQIPLHIMIINRLQALSRMHVEYYTILPITCHYCMFLRVKPISRTIHSHVPGPAKGPGVDEIHGTAVPSPVSGVSPGQVVVVTVGAISKSCAVSEWNSAGISCTHDREPSKDRGGRDEIVNRSLNFPCQTFSGLSTNDSTPGGRMKTKSSLLLP